MSIRPFDWRDLPALQLLRDQSIFLDTALVLTRGSQVVPGALLSFFASSLGVITYVYANDDGKPVVFGQMIHQKGSPFARLTFLTPDDALDSPNLSALLETFMTVSGTRGAFHLLAEVDEKAHAFESLRRSSFAIYSHQRVWAFPDQVKGAQPQQANLFWRSVKSKDMPAIRSLYSNLVPGLVQQVEPFSIGQKPNGLVFEQNGELKAFIEFSYGNRGIWAHPFIHPDAGDVSEQLLSLIDHLPNRRSRPVFVCIRSYQSWLEPTLEFLGASVGPRQAVMVKHLVLRQKATRPFAVPVLETSQSEITAPLARTESR